MKELVDVAATGFAGQALSALGTLLLAALLVAGAVGCSGVLRGQPPVQADFFAATNGNDAWSGALAEPNAAGTDGPFATVTRARDAIRKAKAAAKEPRPFRVLVRGGTYRLAEPIVFGPEDSGAADAPVMYEAYPGEQPVLSGGRAVTGWKKGEGDIWAATLPDVKAGKWYFHQLWVNGRRAIRARTPNVGFLRTNGPLPGFENPHKFRGKAEACMGFRYVAGDLKAWDNLADVNLFAYHSWTSSLHWIDKLDTEKHEVRFANRSGWPIGWWDRKQRYFVENYREALDSPGEWYLDRKTGVLSYWPREGEDMATAEVVAPVLGELVRIVGEPAAGLPVEHITLRGLAFRHADWKLPRDRNADGQAAAFLTTAAVYVKGGRYITLDGCEIGHIGTYALWFAQGSQHCVARQCHIHDLGAGGVRIGECASPRKPDDAADHNRVDNCFIHNGGHVFPAGIGVWIGRASWNTIAHCEISNFYYTGVSFGWSWGYAPSSANHNILEYCHIHHIGLGILSDMGGIYTLGDSPGSVIRHNIFHDIYSYSYGGWGLYTDEGSTDILMENNVVYNTKTGGFHQHYGKNNILRNNVLAFSRQTQVQRTREEEHLSFTFERNLLLCSNEQVLGSNWRNGNYKLDHNLYWTASGDEPEFAGRTFAEWQATGQDKHSVVADPKFADPTKGDFSLAKDSPALALGFQPIDTTDVGLHGPAEWAALPAKYPNRPVPPAEPPKPPTFADDFEKTAVGELPEGCQVIGVDRAKGGLACITDETAASGKHSLKITDAPGLEHVWEPHLIYSPAINTGPARFRFALRVEPGAIFWTEWRDHSSPYKVGPSVHVEKDGRVVVGADTLLTLPHGQWVRFQIDATLGRKTDGKWTLTVTLPGKAAQTFKDLPFGKADFRKLRWIGVMSMAAEKAVTYLDDLALEKP